MKDIEGAQCVLLGKSVNSLTSMQPSVPSKKLLESRVLPKAAGGQLDLTGNVDCLCYDHKISVQINL